MTIDPSLLSRATFSNLEKREERTLQIYAIRIGWDWTPTEKTRNPTGEILKKLGSNVDPITLIGCAPTSPDRPPTVYDRRVEVVDLGRSRKLAGLLFSALRTETQLERELRQRTQENPVASLMKWLDHKRRSLKSLRTDVSAAIKVGDFGKVLYHWSDKDLARLSIAEGQGEHWRRLVSVISSYENPSHEQYLFEMNKTLGELKTFLTTRKDPANYVQNMFCATAAIYAKEGIYQLMVELEEQIAAFNSVEAARQEIANRYSPPRIPVDFRL